MGTRTDEKDIYPEQPNVSHPCEVCRVINLCRKAFLRMPSESHHNSFAHRKKGGKAKAPHSSPIILNNVTLSKKTLDYEPLFDSNRPRCYAS